MEEPFDEPTEEISLNKDQADALLIILSQHYDLANFRIKRHKDHRDEAIANLLAQYQVTQEEAEKTVDEFNALDISTVATIPCILTEIKEIYPMLEQRSKVESRIKIVQPTWKKT